MDDCLFHSMEGGFGVLSSIPGRESGAVKTTAGNAGKGIALVIVFVGLIFLFVK